MRFPYPDLPPGPRVLVIRPDRVGDVLLSTPVVQTLRRRWPEGYIAMMVRPYTRDLLIGNPCIDEILTDDPAGSDAGVTGFLRQIRLIRSRRFDAALMLLPTMRMAWMLFLAGVSLRVGVGRTIYQTLTRTRSVSRNKYIPLRHESDYCLDLARALGADPDQDRPALFLSDDERAQARNTLEAAGATTRPLIGIHPGNGRSAPNWSPEQYAALAGRAQARFGGSVVVTGTAQEKELADRMRQSIAIPMIALTGLTLRQLAAVLGELDVLISSSTGPMHIAAAMNTPTVSLFCPHPARSPARWGPLSPRSRILTPPEGECPTCDRGPMCALSGVTVDMAMKAMEETLNHE